MPLDGSDYKTEVQLTLIAARELVAKRWCKGKLRKDLKYGPAFCVIGAIRHVALDGEMYRMDVPPVLFDRMGEAEKAFKSVIPFYESSIQGWNDAKGRKKTEVLEAFDKAIAVAGVKTGEIDG